MRSFSKRHSMYKPIYIAVLYCILAISVIALSFVVVYADDSLNSALMGEGQFIEVASCVLWLVCAVLGIVTAVRWRSITWVYIGCVTFLFALRELDFDKKFTTMGLLKSKFYFSNAVPMGEKIIGIFVIVVLLFLAVNLIRIFVQTVRKNHYKITWESCISLSVFGMLGVAKTFDGLPRKLGDFGIETSIFAAQVFVAAEEVLELGAPLMVLLGLYAYTLRRNEEQAGR